MKPDMSIPSVKEALEMLEQDANREMAKDAAIAKAKRETGDAS
jgi:hypothetical protein